MLVLSRRVGETIVIGGDIKVTVEAVQKNKVRLGVTAPTSVQVDRLEVHERRRASDLWDSLLVVCNAAEGETSMKTAKQGDRIQVHYVKRFGDGSVVSSRGKSPLELTVGEDHPRLPGLGSALVGLSPGETTKLTVPPEQAYGLRKPDRILRWSRRRFPGSALLQTGEFVHVTNSRGRRRWVRILQVREQQVVVDANHRWAGQAMELKVRLHTILTATD